MKPEQLSKTAAFIAIKFYGLTLIEPYRSWFDPAVVRYYDRLVRSLPSPLHRYHARLKRDWIRKFLLFFEELLLPGDLLHILTRKYFIQRRVEELLAKGYEQLVVPGSGLDHLAVFCSQKGVSTVEIDTPRMARIKRSFIREYGYGNRSLSIKPAYLNRASLRQTLEASKTLDPSRKTVLVTEGFLDYLAPEEVKEMVEDISRFFKHELRVISTVFALDELPAFYRWVFRAGVSAVGEKLRLNLSVNELQKVFTDTGYRVERIMDSVEMRRRFHNSDAAELPALAGFYLIEFQK